MATWSRITITEQAARHLREGLLERCWGDLPGRDQLAADLGVPPMTVVKAMKELDWPKVMERELDCFSKVREGKAESAGARV